MSQHSLSDFALSVISFHEQVIGVHSFINRAQTNTAIARGYTLLLETIATAKSARTSGKRQIPLRIKLFSPIACCLLYLTFIDSYQQNMATDPCYNRFFEYITDPVQRNSLRQQWSQMLNAGLSNADLRILLDKYPDFRFAVQELIRNRIADDQYLDYPEKIKEFATIFPEFKQLVDQQIKALPELRRMREFMRKIKEENKQDEEQVRKMYEARFAEEQAKMWDYRNGPPSSYF